MSRNTRTGLVEKSVSNDYIETAATNLGVTFIKLQLGAALIHRLKSQQNHETKSRLVSRCKETMAVGALGAGVATPNVMTGCS
jgi:hypothetical protein